MTRIIRSNRPLTVASLLLLSCCILSYVGAFRTSVPIAATPQQSSIGWKTQQTSFLRPSTSSGARISPFRNGVESSSSRSSRFHAAMNDDDGQQQQFPSGQQKATARLLRKGLALSVGISCATLLSLNAAGATGLDLASISGGAGALATSTATFMNSLKDTGFYQAFSLVFLSEIGDKTFFIAGLLAMKTSRFVSYLGSMGALAVMTVLSVIIGQVFHAVPSGFAQGIPLDDVAAVLAFAFFGFKTLKEAFDMEEGESIMDEELADAEEAVEGSDTVKQATAWAQVFSIFGLVFAAEFGDRSFLSTIALSAAQNPVSVAGGAIAAHGLATGIAVSGGSFIAKYISEKVIGIVGGVLFLVFAATTAFGIF